MSVIQQVVCLCYLLSCFSSVMCRPQLRPFEYRSRTAEVKTEVGANSQPFAALESRTLNDDGSLSVEEAAISILLKLKIFPFRKPSNESAVDGRNGDLSRDNGVWGAGIDFGLPNGSGFGYGEDASFNTFSFSSVSYIFK
ncbi:hypothetical protein GHT06_021895 [Daphnia sinensis]|uniref:Uncharacterized protein n=1 Tax=Daphnia sinensis TaxID=1820382 RepID=A0AAD5KGB5_9CRUS|nr:hypothetical protein GHT06_021895 [Daphnia sinensis]